MGLLTSLSPEMGRSARGMLFPSGAFAKYGIGVRTRPGTAVSSEIVHKKPVAPHPPLFYLHHTGK
jgi:hypothetical protein